MKNGAWTKTTLGTFVSPRGKSIDPSKRPNEIFELYSVPSFPDRKPEIIAGKEIGSNKQEVHPCSVLLCKINPRINRAWMVGDFSNHPKIASTEWIIFPENEAIEPSFFSYFLQQNAVRDFLAANASGVGGSLMRVKPSTLRDFPFAYPERDEQRGIVAEIEKQFTRSDAGVASLKRVQTALKRYRASVLKAACEGRLVPSEAELAGKENRSYETGDQLLQRILNERREKWDGKGKYKEPVAPEIFDLPAIPEGWTWARLEQMGFVVGGLTKNPARAKLPNQLPYLRVANVYANELRLDSVETIGVKDSEFEKLRLERSDLLIVEGNGSKDQIGRLAIWDGSIEPCVHQNHVIKVRLVEPTMAQWILDWLLSSGGRQYVELVASSTSGLYTLSINKVGDLPMPLPPLAEQVRIVAEIERRLSVVEETERLLSAEFGRASRLRATILSRAFGNGSDTRH